MKERLIIRDNSPLIMAHVFVNPSSTATSARSVAGTVNSSNSVRQTTATSSARLPKGCIDYTMRFLILRVLLILSNVGVEFVGSSGPSVDVEVSVYPHDSATHMLKKVFLPILGDCDGSGRVAGARDP